MDRIDTTPSLTALTRQHDLHPLAHSLRKYLLHIVYLGPFRLLIAFAGFALVSAGAELALEGQRPGSDFAGFFQSLWFTIVTMATVGYGDMTPVTFLGRLWAMMEMFVGVAMVGIITGNIASLLVEQSRTRALGLARLTHLSGHAVICGWKAEMKEILLGVLEANPSLDSDDLVLVTTAPPNEISDLRREKRLRHLHYVFGSHTDHDVLRSAQIGKAARVVILAETDKGESPDQTDARSVLASATVESLNREVYTCTEIIQPHYIRYLRHARVEEVVLNEVNVRRLLVAGSLGDGIGNAMSLFFPENGAMLRTAAIPPHLAQAPYGEVEAYYRGRGFLAVGFLEHTGNLYDRKRESLSAALKTPTYREAVQGLAVMTRLQSNQPTFNPHPQTPLPRHGEMLVILPRGETQPKEEVDRRRGQSPQPRPKEPERLLICGWKPNMAEVLERILAAHQRRGRELTHVAVISRMPESEARRIGHRPELASVVVIEGEPTDPATLRRAAIQETDRVLVLGSPSQGRTRQEIDSRNVMTCIAIHDLNRRVYKCVEMLDPSFGKHLQIADVEEIVYTHRFQQVMLAESSSGSGLSHAIRAMLEPETTPLRVVDFPPAPPGRTFEQWRQDFAAQGQALIGLIDHSGNHYARKQEFLYEAQIQPKIDKAIEGLLRLKRFSFNQPILNPGPDYLPGDRSLAVVVTRSG